MAEMMAVEAIIDAYWQLQGFWTKPRFAFQTPKGGWADVDVLAYLPERQHLVIAESKVQFGKTQVFAYASAARDKYQKGFFEYQQYAYLKFLVYIPVVREKAFVSGSSGIVKKLTVQFVSNYYLSEEEKTDAIAKIRERVIELTRDVEVEVLIHSTLEVFCEVVKLEYMRDQGRRSGNCVIDIARELNRYLHPQISDAGNEREEIEIELLKPLKSIFGKQ